MGLIDAEAPSIMRQLSPLGRAIEAASAEDVLYLMIALARRERDEADAQFRASVTYLMESA